MACKTCKEYLEKGVRFCGNCGSKLDIEAAQAASKKTDEIFDVAVSDLESIDISDFPSPDNKQEVTFDTGEIFGKAEKKPAKPEKPAEDLSFTTEEIFGSTKKEKPPKVEKKPEPVKKKPAMQKVDDDDELDVVDKLFEEDKKKEKKAEAKAQKPNVEKKTDIGTSYIKDRLGKVSEYYSKSTELFKAEPSSFGNWALAFLFVGGLVTFFVYLAVKSSLPMLIPILSLFLTLLVTPVLTSGYYLYVTHVANYTDTSPEDFQFGKECIKPLLMLGWLSAFLSCIPLCFWAFPYASVVYVDGVSIKAIIATFIGFFISLILCTYTSSLSLFSTILMCDRQLKYSEAMKISVAMVNRHPVSFLFFNFGIIGRNFLGLLPAGFGLIYTLPVTAGAIFYAYDDMFGIESETFMALE